MAIKRRIYTPHRLTPVQRTAISLDSEHLCVILCGSLPTMMAYLLVRDDVLLYAVRTSAELKETLLDEGGIPADLVFVEAHRLSDLPQMSFFSPADDHESTVVFSPDLFPDDGQVSGFYAMVDGMLEKKRQQTEKIWKLFEKENGDCEVPMKG